MYKKVCLFCLLALFLIAGNPSTSLPYINQPIIAEAAEAEAQSSTSIWSSPDGKVNVDASDLSNGYLKVRYNGSNKNVKVIITKDGNASYPYWLESNEYEPLSLTFGNGNYHIMVLENTEGNYFSLAFSKEFSVNLNHSTAPFLNPNFFVNYNDTTSIVKVASSLYAESNSELEFVEKTYDYVKQYSYDHAKSSWVSSPNALYKTNLDEIYLSQEGICLDYAAIMVAMLRSQGVPAKLEFGYIGDIYHSWVNAYVNGHWEIYDPTFASSLDEATLMSLINNPNYYNPIFVN